MPNFDEISESTADIKLLPVSENGRPLYWNSISGFDFDGGHVILRLLAKFCRPSNQTIVGGVITSYPVFLRWPLAAILDLIWVTLDHPRSAIADPWSSNLVLLIRFIVSEIL